jgi:putative ABC transport system permease protein
MRRRRSTDDFSEEIRAHIAHETESLIADGMGPDEAARVARQRFGNVTSATERFHESRRRRWLDELRQDFHAARRNLVRYPIVAIVAVLSLGAGIGATAASLTIRDTIFQNPPPLWVAPEQLSRIQVQRHDRPIRPIGSYVPADLFTTWRGAMGASIAAADVREGASDVRIGNRVEPTRIRPVTANLFEVLGVTPEIGRGFSSSGDASNSPAILSYRLWQDWFAGRQDALGATIWINEQPHTVIGVMPRRFWFSELNDPVWTLLDSDRSTATSPLEVIVRRPRGMSTDALTASLGPSLNQYSKQLPADRGPLKMRVSGIKGTPMADQMSMILPYVLATAVLLTLLIACANVAILMIAQWTRREAETAVRAALGASRPRLIRGMVAESVLLAACAGALGIGGTYLIRAVMLRGGDATTFLDFSIHPGVLIKTIAITLSAGIIAGLGPALLETRRLQIDPLRSMAAADRVRQRWSHALVAVEITFTLALLVVTTSMISGLQNSRGTDIGFDLNPLVTASVQSSSGVPTAQLVEAIARVPGVSAISPATSIPLNVGGRRQAVSATATGTNAVQAERISIAPDFFSILGVPMRAGRAFTRLDTPQIRAAIVSESFARQVFGDASAIGRQVWMDKTAYDIVGVVADYNSVPVESRLAAPKVFLPLPAETKDATSMRFLIRATGDPGALVEPIRRALRSAAVGINVSNVVTMRQMITIVGQEYLAGTAPLFPLIVIGMMLTSSGIYGVLAFAVSRRSRELAIRVAIGAHRGNQIRLVMAHSLRLVAIGSACGIGLTFGLSRLVRAAGGAGTLYDPPWPAFVLPVLIVIVVAALATWIPARRALRVNPASLLKAT